MVIACRTVMICGTHFIKNLLHYHVLSCTHWLPFLAGSLLGVTTDNLVEQAGGLTVWTGGSTERLSIKSASIEASRCSCQLARQRFLCAEPVAMKCYKHFHRITALFNNTAASHCNTPLYTETCWFVLKAVQIQGFIGLCI